MKLIQYIQNPGYIGGAKSVLIDYHKLFNDNEYEMHTIIPKKGIEYKKFLGKRFIYEIVNSPMIFGFFQILIMFIKIRPQYFISHGGKGAIIAKILRYILPFAKYKIITIHHTNFPLKKLVNTIKLI
ncbi:hypothetical protein N9C35_02635 [Flavobacteriaceae bacterium]|nr:hypothetical protein [Flavobacteriaceae bacterium]